MTIATKGKCHDEIESSFRYLSGYSKPKPMAEQVRILQIYFPGLAGDCCQLSAGQIPPLAEGWFAIPRWQTIAPVYNDALETVLAHLETSRAGVWFNNRAGQIGQAGLRQLPDSATSFEVLSDRQGQPDILAVPAQFALRHRGRSVARARQCYVDGEFGLGAFHIAIMLLTHPERLLQENDLFVDAPGDVFDDGASDIRFGRTPCLCFEQERLEFGTHWTDRAYDYNGSATAFLPTENAVSIAIRDTPPVGAFAEEELAVPTKYPTSYEAPRSLDEQLATLRAAFPQLARPCRLSELPPLPAEAEGYFAVPRWECVAATYNDALELILDRLKSARGGHFHNFRRGRLGPEVLRQHAMTSEALARVSMRQGAPDVLLIAAQFGAHHLGRSVRRARSVFTEGEFGLGGFQVAAMVLTHPERLANPNWRRQRIASGGIQCPGDEYDDAVRRYGRVPCFFYDGGEEEFGTHWIHRAEASSGSVTAFLP